MRRIATGSRPRMLGRRIWLVFSSQIMENLLEIFRLIVLLGWKLIHLKIQNFPTIFNIIHLTDYLFFSTKVV